VQNSLGWRVERDVGPVSIMLPMQNGRGRGRLKHAPVLNIHRIEILLAGIYANVAEGWWQNLVKVTQKQCVDATLG
jgi:hypothetical protein